MKNKLLIVALISFAVAARWLPHAPNFSPVGAIALFSGVLFPTRHAFFIPLAGLFISDLFLGFHPIQLWVYGSYALIVVLGFCLKNSHTFSKMLAFSLAGSILFFLVTNFGVWLTTHMYAKSVEGLVECFWKAIPFFRNTLAGDLFYTSLFCSIAYVYSKFFVQEVSLRKSLSNVNSSVLVS